MKRWKWILAIAITLAAAAGACFLPRSVRVGRTVNYDGKAVEPGAAPSVWPGWRGQASMTKGPVALGLLSPIDIRRGTASQEECMARAGTILERCFQARLLPGTAISREDVPQEETRFLSVDQPPFLVHFSHGTVAIGNAQSHTALDNSLKPQPVTPEDGAALQRTVEETLTRCLDVAPGEEYRLHRMARLEANGRRLVSARYQRYCEGYRIGVLDESVISALLDVTDPANPTLVRASSAVTPPSPLALVNIRVDEASAGRNATAFIVTFLREQAARLKARSEPMEPYSLWLAYPPEGTPLEFHRPNNYFAELAASASGQEQPKAAPAGELRLAYVFGFVTGRPHDLPRDALDDMHGVFIVYVDSENGEIIGGDFMWRISEPERWTYRSVR